MNNFHYKAGELFCENVKVKDVAADVGTPFYLYSADTFRNNYKEFDEAFAQAKHLVCYAVKTNDSMSVLKILSDEGAGADIVSGGELFKAKKAGFDPRKTVFAGVAKTEREIKEALEADILMFNVESFAELELINKVAKAMNKKARISFRVNPDIDPKTHPYISTALAKNKFGISINHALDSYSKASEMDGIEIVGIQVHLGSQITTISPFVEALQKVLKLAHALGDMGIELKYIDLGGGLGVTYKDERPPGPQDLARELLPMIKKVPYTIIFEPGRYISATAGILVSKVLFTKQTTVKKFVIVDAAMNDMARPFIYDAYHEILPVEEEKKKEMKADVVGGVCESTDYFARDRSLPILEAGDLIALMNSGAYGFVMSSNYNSRPKVAEVMVEGDSYSVIRKRQNYEDLIRDEEVPSPLK
ncbi:MAG: diaminopimelate decarboxylase [bacterium]